MTEGNYFVDVRDGRAFTSLEFLRDIDKRRSVGMSRREAIAWIVGAKMGYVTPEQQAGFVEELVRETAWLGDGPDDGLIRGAGE